MQYKSSLSTEDLSLTKMLVLTDHSCWMPQNSFGYHSVISCTWHYFQTIPINVKRSTLEVKVTYTTDSIFYHNTNRVQWLVSNYCDSGHEMVMVWNTFVSSKGNKLLLAVWTLCSPLCDLDLRVTESESKRNQPISIPTTASACHINYPMQRLIWYST